MYRFMVQWKHAGIFGKIMRVNMHMVFGIDVFTIAGAWYFTAVVKNIQKQSHVNIGRDTRTRGTGVQNQVLAISTTRITTKTERV